MLAPITGGTIAHQAGRFVESAASWFNSASVKAQASTKDYLQDEVNLLVPPTLSEEFNEQVTELREGVDRADARLRRLEQRKLSRSVVDSSESSGSSGNSL